MAIEDEAQLESAEAKRSVLGRAFEILDCFAGGTEMGVSGICQRTGLPAATVHRVLANLVAWGAVEKPAHGRYRLGPRIWRLGLGSQQARVLREVSQPHLLELHLATGGTAYLGVRDGADAVFSDRISRVKPTATSMRATRRLPLEKTGGGRILLAYSPDAWEELIKLADVDAATAQRVTQLRPQLAQVRARGYGIFHNDGLAGRTAVAAPVFGGDGEIVASVTAAFPDTRITDPQSIAPRVVASAREIARDLMRYTDD